ncbi:mRNA interferase HicA [Lentzea fradiae]|uniref:mRNA interferase HicA n=1 Tax=Lentzea fradiae TaxID=200378 RepID=A0A1G7KRV9_9PSEU|nr:lantibiotic dehydratase [Lentzea fradiae]SDF39826.1 mRNA interferase HicA [Lentzea fradiae]
MDTRFVASDRFLLRAPVLPRVRLRPSEAGVRERVEAPMVREAVAVASPALSEAVGKLLAGHEPPDAAARRLRGALARYELRMAGRPTPFGLLAGVAVGRFAATADAGLGTHHRRHVHPDHGWLHEWATELEADPGVLAGLEVTANTLCTRHGGRLVVPRGTRLAGVRRTPAVARMIEIAATRPIAVHELVRVVGKEFPGVRRSGFAALVRQLVRLGFLQTELRRPGRSFDDLVRLLPAESSHGERAELVAKTVDVYRRSPVGNGADDLSAVRRAAGADNPVQVDLELDARVRLPYRVAREIERAADAVWRLSAHENMRSRNLVDFHARFLERYGIGEPVPVLDLLDPDAGIGPPAGYEQPWSASEAEQDGSRHAVLTRLLAEALADGVTEVVLDDDLIARLCPPGGSPPAAVELFTTLHAASAEALERGDFELVVSPLAGTQQGGASLARFGHLPEVRGLLAELAAVGADDRLPVQLVHATTNPRDANLARAPQVLCHTLAVGVPGLPGALMPGDIVVTADERRLRLHSLSLGREIAPRVLHVLDISAAAPEVVRFLWDVSLMGVRTLKPWDWAGLRDAPFLPAVRYGRTVLSPARWRAGEAEVGADEALAAWRRRWRVPDRVRVTHHDQQLCLDLTSPEHRALLRDELRKSGGTVVLCEDRAPALDEGWLRGPDGAHEAELVVPLVAVEPKSRPARPSAPLRTKPVAHLPGGDWVSAHVLCSARRQREVLVSHLGPWLDTLESVVDRWFFVRYQSQDEPPHIRLRLHGDVLPQVRDQVAALVDARLSGGFSVHPYRPEVERYGGEPLLGLAERFFAADSGLALRKMSAAQDSIAVAADVTALVRCFHGVQHSAEWPSWLLSAMPKNEATHQAFAHRRGDALAAITLEPVAADREWGEVLSRYGKEARALAESHAWVSPDEILRALLHLHCNRRLGADFRAEAEVYAMARGAVQAHVDRRRHAR